MTIYPFTAEHFHVDEAKLDHRYLYYTVDEASLAVHMDGQYELGELTSIREALVEANRLFKHRCWVEIRSNKQGIAPFYKVVRWQGGVSHKESGLHGIHSECWDRLHELCKPGHAADFGWLKE